MDLAYALATVIVSRAGALSVSELALVAKPAILVPSPNVAEDHQTKNARALVDRDAAILVTDAQAQDHLHFWKTRPNKMPLLRPLKQWGCQMQQEIL